MAIGLHRKASVIYISSPGVGAKVGNREEVFSL